MKPYAAKSKVFSFFARRKYKLLQQVRKPVGGASEVIEGEEVALLGQTTDLGSNATSSSGDLIDVDVPMLKVESSDIPSDDTPSSLGDMTLMERPLPIGAEDS